MTRPPLSPNQKRVSAGAVLAGAQIATSNNTANAFLGGRRPSWLTAGPSGQRAAIPPAANTVASSAAPPAPPAAPPTAPTAVPPAASPTLPHGTPKAAPAGLSQTSDSSLLSPAPTDEASPAEAAREDDSPLLHMALLPEQRQRQVAPNTRTVVSGIRTTQDEAVGGQGRYSLAVNGSALGQPGPAADSPRPPAYTQLHNPRQRARATELEAAAAEGSTSTAFQPQAALVSTAPGTAPATMAGQATFAVIDPSQAALASPATITTTGRTPTAEHDVYFPRRVVTKSTPSLVFKYADYIPFIDEQIASLGGHASLTVQTEAPRLSLLTEACRSEDGFFVAVHQLFCLWAVDSNEAYYRLRPLAPQKVDESFRVLQTVFKSNDLIRATLRKWLSQFPLTFEAMVREPSLYGRTMAEVGAFLTCLPLHWNTLSAKVAMRRYPLLMDELVSQLFCLSPTLQKILFTASRRRLEVHDGQFGFEIERHFHADQSKHQPVPGTFIGLPCSRFSDELETVNAQLIGAYRHIIIQCKAESVRRLSAQRTLAQSQLGANGQPTAPTSTLPAQQPTAPQAPRQQYHQLGRGGFITNPNGGYPLSLHSSTTAAGRASASNSLDGGRASPMQPDQNRAASLQHTHQHIQQNAHHRPRQSSHQDMPHLPSPTQGPEAHTAMGQPARVPPAQFPFSMAPAQMAQQGPQSPQIPQTLQMPQQPQMTRMTQMQAHQMQVQMHQAQQIHQMQQMQQMVQMQQPSMQQHHASLTQSGQEQQMQLEAQQAQQLQHLRQLHHMQRAQQFQQLAQEMHQNTHSVQDAQQAQQFQQIAQEVQQLQQRRQAPQMMQPFISPQMSQLPQMVQDGIHASAHINRLQSTRPPEQHPPPQSALQSPAPSPMQSPNLAQQAHLPRALQTAYTEHLATNAAAVSSNARMQQAVQTVPTQWAVSLPPHQQPLQSPRVLQHATGMQQPAAARPATPVRPTHKSIFPPAGSVISRSEFPHDPSDKRALSMSLTQADRRSPTRVVVDLATKTDSPPNPTKQLFYQSVQRMAVGPTPTPARPYLYNFEFMVTEEDYALRVNKSVPEGELLPVEKHFDGSLRYRLRCCRARSEGEATTESDWVTRDTYWPTNIFINFNDNVVPVRRQSHNGKDLPVSITHLVRVGVNKLQVAIPDTVHQSTFSKRHVLGVEIIETAQHDRTLLQIIKGGFEAASVTVGKIKARLRGSTAGDDDFAVLQDGLSVDLADPFSARIFTVPVRGAQCQHIECFDLNNWLSTRPPSTATSANCQHRFNCKCPDSLELTLPDKWRCPICSRDARPGSLRIDGFLVAVQKQLKESGKLSTVKSILVAPDGTWQPVIEAEEKAGDQDGDNDSDDDDGEDNDNRARNGDNGNGNGKKRVKDGQQSGPPQKVARMGSVASAAGSATRASGAQPIDIIELDD